MAKDDRSAINPFTGKSHLDLVDDDKLLSRAYNEYYGIINNSQLLDDTEQGKLVRGIAQNLIGAVETFLANIGRSDYTEDYYDWEFHLLANHTVNAWCMPGGKIVMYSGMLGPAESEDDIALVLGHEMAHALLDHIRTQQSARNAKNAVTTAAWIGSIGLSLFGFGEAAAVTRAVTNIADIGSEFLILKPFGRDHEFEADKLGMMIMHWAGYDISGVPDFWSRVSSQNKNENDFFSTHPADSKRIANMKQLIYEIGNGVDFYNSPVLGDSSTNQIPQSLDNKIECPNCKRLIDDTSGFCCYCGSNLNSIVKCPNCGKIIDDNSKFCTDCGTPIEKTKICSNCGEVFTGDFKFCTNCGSKL